MLSDLDFTPDFEAVATDGPQAGLSPRSPRLVMSPNLMSPLVRQRYAHEPAHEPRISGLHQVACWDDGKRLQAASYVAD